MLRRGAFVSPYSEEERERKRRAMSLVGVYARAQQRERETESVVSFLFCLFFCLQAELLSKLRADNHRCLLFTQFSKMLDVLEAWINHQGFTYVRLDGSTKVRLAPSALPASPSALSVPLLTLLMRGKRRHFADFLFLFLSLSISMYFYGNLI